MSLATRGTIICRNIASIEIAGEDIIASNTMSAPSIAAQEIAASLRMGTLELLVSDYAFTQSANTLAIENIVLGSGKLVIDPDA
jgi:hypothetical protein